MSGVKIEDGHADLTNMGSLAMLTMEIIKMLSKSTIKDWFNCMKNNYPFLAINLIDTFNQGWINWIKACLQLAHSKDTPHAQAAPDELKYAFKILSNIPKSIMEASQKNNIGIWTNPCTLYLNMQKEKETVEPKKRKNNNNDTNPRPRQGGGGYHQNRPFLNLHQDIGGYHQDRQNSGG